MKVSSSILAVKSNYLEYARMLKYVNVDYIHVDIFQNGKDFRLEQLLEFDNTYLPLDVHLIFDKISNGDIEILNRAKVKFMNIQYETLKDKTCIKAIAEKFNGNFGLAITSETPLKVIEQYINHISQVLFMCSAPGITGAKFDESNLERIEELHKRHPSLNIYADGGINNMIAEKMEKLGVSMVVSGFYLSKNLENLDMNTYRLKYFNESDILVTRKMLKINSLPVLSKQAMFMEVVNSMNKYRMGIVFIVENDELLGIITDGDIRRAFLLYEEGIFQKRAEILMNRTPFTIEKDKTIEDIFKSLSVIHKGIDVVPVLENKRLIGAVDLHIGM